MKITFVGHGYVGLVTATVFADLGNTVYIIGRNAEKIKKLAKGDPIIFEPRLSELLKKNIASKRISFTTSYKNAIPKSDVVFIAVGTPSAEDGEADLSAVYEVSQKIAKNLGKKYTVIVCKSTVPVGTNRKIYQLIKKHKPKSVDFDVASCPEFLREGSALQDTFVPDRIVIGANSKAAIDILLKLHKPLNGERVIVSLESAELIKYASNSILATKISFANLISFICEKTGADVEDVLRGVGLDRRIGRVFLYPGAGYGGSCFPKDVKALIKTGESYNISMNLLKSVEEINEKARETLLTKISENVANKKIAIWGLAFKPNTDDIREAPSIHIIKKLLSYNFDINVYDPEAMENTKKKFADKITFAENPYRAVDGVDTLAILTEWNEFKQIDLPRIIKLMKRPLVIDGRNIYDPKMMKSLGFNYISVGRSAIM